MEAASTEEDESHASSHALRPVATDPAEEESIQGVSQQGQLEPLLPTADSHEMKPIAVGGTPDPGTPLPGALGVESGNFAPVIPQPYCSSPSQDDTETPLARSHASWKMRVHTLLADPGSSTVAKVLSYFILYTIVMSILGFVLQTVPALHDFDGWYTMELVSTVIFTIEFLTRWAVADAFGEETKFEFLTSPLNVLDFLAIVPFYLELGLSSMDGVKPLRVLRSVRLVRCFRIFKLGKYSVGMNLMAESLINSMQPLSILVFFLCNGLLLFSSLIYYAERRGCPDVADMKAKGTFEEYKRECEELATGLSRSGEQCCNEYGSALAFQSITATFWWSIVTMTTVGYGDRVPITVLGKIVAVLAMLSGIVLFSLPVAIVGTKFQQAYENMELEQARLLLTSQDADSTALDQGSDLSKFKSAKAVQFLATVGADVAAKRGAHDVGKPEAKVFVPMPSSPRSNSSQSDISLDDMPTKSVSRTTVFQASMEAVRGILAPPKAEKPVSMSVIFERLRKKLRRIQNNSNLSESSNGQTDLLLELMDHIERVERQLLALREKDRAMDAKIRKDFAALSREYDSHVRGR